MRRTTRTTWILSAIALLLFSTAGSAFVLLDPPRCWFPEDLSRQIEVDNTGLDSVTDSDGGVAEGVDAADEWEEGDSTHAVIEFLDPFATSVVFELGDGISTNIFDDPTRQCNGRCIAATFVGFFDDNQLAECDGLEVARYTDSDIVWNTRHDFSTESEPDGCSDEIFVEPVMTHEVGHLIGLGHSEVDDALMAPSISSCDNKPLHADDFDGRDVLYDCDSFTLIDGGGDECADVGEACFMDSDCCSNNCSNGRPSTRTCQ